MILGGADKIAFLNENEIWLANLDGSGLEKMTDDKIPKQYLQWTPDGSALTYRANSCYWMFKVGAAQAEKIGCFEDFEISPDLSQVIVGSTVTLPNKNKDWRNYILPYSSLAELQKVTDIQRLRVEGGCLFEGGRQTHFSEDGKRMAGIFKAEQGGRQVDQIIVFTREASCGSSLDWIDIFPGERFTLSGYSGFDEDPTLDDFGWDGKTLFALHGKKRNDLGDLVIYNMNSARAEVKNPIDAKCCYQDIQFSPDGNYLLFVFKDINQETSDQKNLLHPVLSD